MMFHIFKYGFYGQRFLPGQLFKIIRKNCHLALPDRPSESDHSIGAEGEVGGSLRLQFFGRPRHANGVEKFILLLIGNGNVLYVMAGYIIGNCNEFRN